MNEQQYDQKLQKDATRMNKELDALQEDGIDKVNSTVSQLSSKFEKVKGDVGKTVADVSTTVVKNVGDGLRQYNAKAVEVAKNFPGGVGVNAGKYPWVAISFALLAGLLLRGFWMPGRN